MCTNTPFYVCINTPPLLMCTNFRYDVCTDTPFYVFTNTPSRRMRYTLFMDTIHLIYTTFATRNT